MLSVVVGLALLSLRTGSLAQECSFTVDCYSVDKCTDIQDAACVCNAGECVFNDSDNLEKAAECDVYTDCECRDNPSACFCRNGSCKEEKWECHTEQDCSGLDKCKDYDCRCSSYDTCEPYDCYADSDCFTGENDCQSYPGYTCACNSNVCELVYDESYTEGSGDMSCTFSTDCDAKCGQESSCVCKRGQCVVDIAETFLGNECENYANCTCSFDSENCFCRDGYCVEDNWECHSADDCNKFEKCQGIDCRCSSRAVCEPQDCVTSEDCFNGGFDCNSYEGYTCACESNVCNLVRDGSDYSYSYDYNTENPFSQASNNIGYPDY